MIFVDTSAWFAAIVPTDPNHEKAADWLQNNKEILFTTDYIVDETLTLLRARGESRRAISLGKSFFEGRLAVVYRLSATDIAKAWDIFQQFGDKEWSVTSQLASSLTFQRKYRSSVSATSFDFPIGSTSFNRSTPTPPTA